MRRPTRAPVPAPKFIEQALRRALNTHGVADIEGINAHAPKQGTRTWRIRMHFNGVPYERTTSGTFDDVYAAVLELRDLRNSHITAAAGGPEHCFEPLATAIDAYIAQRGPTHSWKTRTMRDRARDLSMLAKDAQANSLQCHQLVPRHLRDFLTQSAATASRGAHLRGVVLTFIKWGAACGYFSIEQYQACQLVQWSAPKGSNYTKAPTRRAQSEQVAASQHGQGGQVMTTAQLLAFANEVQNRYTHGAGLIHLAANLGTRAQETFMLTASADIAANIGANYVDLDLMRVHIDVQVNDDPTLARKSTKNGKTRVVAIPANRLIPSSFDLRSWLHTRCTQALEEQTQGTNPLALLFPGEHGAVLDLQNFNSRVIRPATATLGWRMPGYTDAKGNVRHMHRFTLHSLRDYFAVIAVTHWGYSPIQLLQQGSWSDMQTVNKYYIGTTDDTAQSVQEIHHD